MSNFSRIIKLIVLVMLLHGSCITKTQYSTLLVQPDYQKAYHLARESGDLSSAITTLNFLIAHSPDSLRYFDSLSNLYFNIHAYKQCIHWCKRSLEHQDTNTFALFILGRSYLKINDLQKSVNIFDQLIIIERRPEFILYLAEAQYRLKRLLECIQTTMYSDSISIDYPYKYYYLDTSNRTCTTNIKSTLLNFRGLAFFELGNLDMAEKSFKESLHFDSDFLLSKYNLLTIRRKNN